MVLAELTFGGLTFHIVRLVQISGFPNIEKYAVRNTEYGL
jgi:hypothetical protein